MTTWHRRFRQGRLQSIPDPDSFQRQKLLLCELLSSLSAHPCAHGFVRGRSPETALEPHIGCRYLLHLDLANAFPATTRWHVSMGLACRGVSADLIQEVLDLCMDGDMLPIGAPTSPALFNLALRGIDSELCGLGEYTRYADNLLLSGIDFVPSESEARRIIRERLYQLNESKCWLRVRGKQSLEVFGYVIGENSLRRPKRIRHNQRAAEYQANGES